MTPGSRLPSDAAVHEHSGGQKGAVMKREIAVRQGNGLRVTLYWHTHADRVSVTVEDASRGELFELDGRPDEALDLFHHPYARAAYGGVAA